MLKYHKDMSNQENLKLYKEAENLSADYIVATSFITPEISYSDENEILKYIKNNEKFEPYKRDILDILEQKKHVLNKEEENLIANYSEIIQATENIYNVLTNVEFKFGNLIDAEGKEVPLTDSNYSIYLRNNNIEIRKNAFNLMYDQYKNFNNTISEMYLTNVKATAKNAKLRKYKSSLEEAVIHDDATIKVYESLITAIHKNIEANYKFIELKKKLLDLKELHMYDLYVNPFTNKDENIEYEEAKKEVIAALSILGNDYIEKIKEALENNWVDVFPGDNKKNGGYSTGIYGVHPYILINYLNSQRDVSTLAHELGHSMHTYYSNTNQNIINANYTILVAEVASTVNEILLSDYKIKNEKDNYKKAEMLYELLEMIRATFFRQAMFAEFEKIIHEKIEQNNVISAEDLNEEYYNLNKLYFGQNIIIDENIKYEWSRIPHFYSDFYVYKYATGVSCAITIASKILNKEPGFVEKYINMLKQGCSKKSIDLLKMVDIDLENPETYSKTIEFYNSKIDELNKLI